MYVNDRQAAGKRKVDPTPASREALEREDRLTNANDLHYQK
jgi:hypothetical protein